MTKKAQDAYMIGFRKVAEDHGVDPVGLYKYALKMPKEVQDAVQSAVKAGRGRFVQSALAGSASPKLLEGHLGSDLLNLSAFPQLKRQSYRSAGGGSVKRTLMGLFEELGIPYNRAMRRAMADGLRRAAESQTSASATFAAGKAMGFSGDSLIDYYRWIRRDPMAIRRHPIKAK